MDMRQDQAAQDKEDINAPIAVRHELAEVELANNAARRSEVKKDDPERSERAHTGQVVDLFRRIPHGVDIRMTRCARHAALQTTLATAGPSRIGECRRIIGLARFEGRSRSAASCP